MILRQLIDLARFMGWMLLGFIVSIAFGAVWINFRTRRHRGIPRSEFAAFYRERNIPEEISGLVYDYYSSHTGVNNFTIAPHDRLTEPWFDTADDPDNDIVAMVGQLGLELPPRYKLADWTRPVETVGDMVEWMAWARDKCDPIA